VPSRMFCWTGCHEFRRGDGLAAAAVGGAKGAPKVSWLASMSGVCARVPWVVELPMAKALLPIRTELS